MSNFRRAAEVTVAAILSFALMPGLTASQELSAVRSNGNLHLRGYGSFFMSGTPAAVIDVSTQAPTGQPGLGMANQMYVQFMLPQVQEGRPHSPIVFVHGGTLSSKSWQTTPDGRMGWDEYFVRQGFDTYLADQVGRARSGSDMTTHNAVRNGVLPNTGQALVLIGTDQLAWNNFRFGTKRCTASPCSASNTAHPNIRFPMSTVGVGEESSLQFYNQMVPDILGNLTNATSGCSGSRCLPADPSAFADTPNQMAKLASQLNGAILVGHSQSSTMPTRAALQADSGCYPFTTKEACKVKGIIQLETGCFGNLTPEQINTLSKIPILIMYGDYSALLQPAEPCPTMIAQIQAAGGDIRFAWLPALVANDLYSGSPGPIRGNTHMMMLDNNNLEIAQILINWASARGL
jgi:pimeloyl-ACP methyl ester carboxylesterase